MENRIDVEFALEILRHEGIEIGLYDSGWWMVYYLTPCRFLNLEDSKCRVHGTGLKPRICTDYSPVRCWYQRVFVKGSSADFIRFDLDRFARLAERFRYDDTNKLQWVPEWDEILTIAGPPRSDLPRRPPASAASQSMAPQMPEAPARLIFPMRAPKRPQDFDLLKFRLGFPGVRVGRSTAGWVLVIESRRRVPIDAALAEHSPAESVAAVSPATRAVTAAGSPPLSATHTQTTLAEGTPRDVVIAPSITGAVKGVPDELYDYNSSGTLFEEIADQVG